MSDMGHESDEKLKIGDLLVQHQLISPQQLQNALVEQQRSGFKLGEVLVNLGHIKEEALLQFIAKQMEVPFIDLQQFELNQEVALLLPEAYARRFRAMALQIDPDDRMLVVGMVEPFDIAAVDELKRVLRRPIKVALVSGTNLLQSLNMVYRRTKEISSFAEQLHEEISEDYYDLSSLAKDSEELDAPVVKLIQSIFEDALQVGASDIHIEPTDQGLRIRQRIDGILQGQVMKERDIAQPLSQRLKLMSKLDIAEKRLPQDGSFTIHAHNREIDVRLSTLPTPLGETVVMRLLNQNEAFFTSFETLGMPPEIGVEFNRLVAQPHGVFLVTGPTGSGKSTTLYSVLSNMDCETRKIITIEDPIEYHLENVVQTQVHPKIDLSFARILRTTLRQDPDVLMVGEIRDEETATIAMRAALTGHMVFSTLHTNDSASTAIRLLDMGVEGFLVASALLGVLAQRLVRRICDSCIEDYQPTEQERLFVNAIADGRYSNIPFKHGKGCTYCHHSGFKGRIGVFELLTLSPEMMEALRANNPAQFSKLAEQALQGKLLLDNGLKQVQSGLTTIAEIMRMVGDSSL